MDYLLIGSINYSNKKHFEWYILVIFICYGGVFMQPFIYAQACTIARQGLIGFLWGHLYTKLWSLTLIKEIMS
jgi:hypothetical protein